ncbi:aldo/keto reductase [Streptomyces melanogenes]|uniref:aldo/keto reductase n=1 Tax=Streptomyces melanogenes TaxID=67326 RepID=UPI00167D5B4B|nr:aldo/keto reductase [Streptomyces melanogenes]GGP92103.1 hypothetical protein GCM10010278_82800 [Streptomyces melanogenes]
MRAAVRRTVLGLHRSRHERRLLTGALDLGVTTFDTAYAYFQFRSHKTLAQVAGDLLPKFSVSTKVGYFPDGHSLDPARLSTAVDEAVRDLGREPEWVLLHNPEHSAPAGDALAEACGVLADAAAAGRCGGWGVSTWDPRPLLGQVNTLPSPGVLMLRCGLLVGIDILDSAELLATQWQPSSVWGMSPFGGSTATPVWKTFDPRTFLREDDSATPVQAALRTAFELPVVDAVAVGTDDLGHLKESASCLTYEVDHTMVRQYRDLLRSRQAD